MTHRKGEQRQKERRESKNRKGERDQLTGWGDKHRRQDNDGRGRGNKTRGSKETEGTEPHDSPHCAAHSGLVYYHPSLNFKTLPPLLIVVHSSQNCVIYSLFPSLPHKMLLRIVSCSSSRRSHDAYGGCHGAIFLLAAFCLKAFALAGPLF